MWGQARRIERSVNSGRAGGPWSSQDCVCSGSTGRVAGREALQASPINLAANISTGRASINKMMASAGVGLDAGQMATDLPNLLCLQNAVVFDANQKPHRFSDFYRHKTALFVFLRNFIDYITIDYARDLAKIKDFLEERNVTLVPIGCAPCMYIAEFQNLTRLRPVFSDPERVIYTNLDLLTHTDYSNPGLTSSPHVHTNMLSGVLQGSLRAMKSMDFQGDIKQNGGALIVRPDNQVLFVHRDRGAFDHARIVALMSALDIDLNDALRAVQSRRQTMRYFITPRSHSAITEL